MTAEIFRTGAAEAWDLIFTEHLATLPTLDQESMHRAMHNSTRLWVGMEGRDVLAVWGLIPPTLLSDSAYLWLFTTAALKSHVFLFVRHSRRQIELMLQEYPTLEGHTAIDNRRAQQWLRWLGAEFGPPIHGSVLPFTIRSESWQQALGRSA